MKVWNRPIAVIGGSAYGAHITGSVMALIELDYLPGVNTLCTTDVIEQVGRNK